jgi:chromosome segregation protein
LLLKSLELQGFKTFPEKTVLTFNNGITAVVGPNGSGKSNISDAMRWVLGEQSARILRCTKMEDVIFNGTPKRKPLGFAEVSLLFDNTDRTLPFDSDEVSVTRRYYRSGESEYQINKASVRLKDVNELFMDTGLGRDGYSMIGQGKIDSIVAARSEDRRVIFEEAAGISRFRYRKEESERRLSQAEENLLRLHDILSELESRVGPLREQAEKAKEYLALAKEKRELEIGLWLETLNRSGRLLREQEDRILTVRAQYDAAEQEINGIDQKIEEVFGQSNASSARIDEERRQSSLLEENAAKKDGEASVLENDIRHNEEDIARMEREITESAVSGEEMDRQIAEANQNILKKQEYIKESDAEHADISSELDALRSGMDEASAKIDRLTRDLVGLSARATEAKVSETSALSSITEITLRQKAVLESAADKQSRKETLNQSAEEISAKLRELDERLEALQNTVKGYEMRLQSRGSKKESARQLRDKLRLDAEGLFRRAHLLEDLERNLEGFSQSVKAVMQESSRGTLKGVHGPVSRLLKVPEPYAVAMETALGSAMQNIVVGSEDDAKSAINLLKQRNSGRATFLPLTTIRGRLLEEKGLEQCPGFVGVAAKLCSCDSAYNDILNSLLGRIVISEDLDSAVAIARRYSYRFRIVTLDGQVVNAGGSMTGGSLARNSGLLSRASEIEKLKREAAGVQQKAEQAEAALKTATEELSAAEAALAGANGELASAREEKIHAEAERRRITSELESFQRDLETLDKEKSEAENRLKELEARRTEARREAEEIEGQANRLQEELTGISGNKNELNRQCDELSEKLRQIELDRLAAQKDIESLRASAADIELRKAGHREKAEALKTQIAQVQTSTEQLRGGIARLKEEAQTMRREAEDAGKQIEELNLRRMELEKQSAELRAKEREKSEEKEKTGHELARLEERKAGIQKDYDEIIARLWEEYELTRREAEEQVETKITDPAAAQRRLAELKSRIKALGSVNVSAVDEYREVSERYEFLKSQVSDVEDSRDELKKLIGNLTRQMRELFTERFSLIRQNFVQTFRELFGGGTADLTLSEPEDVLNSGIDISVQPPGKIVAHLEALSGGEKALVAIALYFAIMKVNPPPFCVLDEIEAALDDVNVDRFAAYLRRMTQNTQYIMITHRRGSMEEADVLYGVTMQDEGVSKLLEMPVAEMEAKIGIEAR